MQQQTVGHISVNGIIYRAANPAQIFTDIKDDTYPHIVWRGCICLIGGNWTGESAADDSSPMMTFIRKMLEELSFEKPVQSTAELGETSLHTAPTMYRVKGGRRPPTPDEQIDLLLRTCS